MKQPVSSSEESYPSSDGDLKAEAHTEYVSISGTYNDLYGQEDYQGTLSDVSSTDDDNDE